MKAILIPVLLFFMTINSFGQEFQKPAEGKSLVYFARYGGALALIDFRYFDGQNYLGKVGGNNYFIYECDPGEHVFWVSAENYEFIKGDLKPNSTYVIEVRPYARVVMAGVELIQISPENKKALTKIRKVIEKGKQAEMKGQDEDLTSVIEYGMERYEKIEPKVARLNPDWTF